MAESDIPVDDDISPLDLAIQDDAATGGGEEVSPEEGIRRLQEQLDAEKAARANSDNQLAAERARTGAATTQAATAQAQAHAANIQTVKTAIDRIKERGDALEQAYAEHAAAGDWTEAAKAQREMGKVEATMLRMGETLTNLERGPAAAPRPAVAPDRVEELTSQMGQWPKSQAWVRAHPEYVRDDAKYAQMIAAHNAAVVRHQPDTPGYFAMVEYTLGMRDSPTVDAPTRDAAPAATQARGVEDDAGAGEGAAEQTGGRSVRPPAAPVTRQGAPGAQRQGSIRLTPAQREAAEISGLSYQEYADQLARVNGRAVQ